MLIAITADAVSGGYWLRIRDDIPRIFCGSRETAIRVLTENPRLIVR